MMHVLLTGASGFLGGWVAAGLTARGVTVSPFPGRRLLAPTSDVAADLRPILRQVDAICHLAASTTQQPGPPTPDDYATGNVDATRRLLDLLLPRHHIVFASTATISGLSARQPDTVAGDRVAYAESKLLAERLVAGFTESGGTGVSLRFCALGGAGSDERRGVIAAALNAAQRGTAFPVFGDDSVGREYLNVYDAARAVVAALERPLPKYAALPVGSGQLSTVDDVLAAVEAVTQQTIRRQFLPPRGDVADPPTCDVAATEAALGWRPLRSSLVTIVRDQWTERHSQGLIATQVGWATTP